MCVIEIVGQICGIALTCCSSLLVYNSVHIPRQLMSLVNEMHLFNVTPCVPFPIVCVVLRMCFCQFWDFAVFKL
jgi:hypothetical protein